MPTYAEAQTQIQRVLARNAERHRRARTAPAVVPGDRVTVERPAVHHKTSSESAAVGCEAIDATVQAVKDGVATLVDAESRWIGEAFAIIEEPGTAIAGLRIIAVNR